MQQASEFQADFAKFYKQGNFQPIGFQIIYGLSMVRIGQFAHGF